MTPTGPPDPFDTAGRRRRVLVAWADSPARFREDANAEEDLVVGGYRDRWLIELAQNAADAAARAGVPGRLRLELAGDELRAANTGAPLDADGVQGLSTLRASGKRSAPTVLSGTGPKAAAGDPTVPSRTGPQAAAGDPVGRFGVGFAAVLALTDAPEIRSRDGGVGFDLARSREQTAAVPSLAAEMAARDGAVPVLRLPFPVDRPPPDGYATEVRLPLRPGRPDTVRAELAALAPDLLLALPGLAEILVVVDGRERLLARRPVTPDLVELSADDVTVTWRVAFANGHLSPALLAGRPVEERRRTAWSVLWAVPLSGDRPMPLAGRQVVHAPTPSDEPLSLPVRLIGSFPLDPDRRHVAPGPVADHLVARAATAFADLVHGCGPHPEALDLLPRPGFGTGELDAALRAAITDELRTRAWLPTVTGETVAAARAVVLDGADERLIGVLTGERHGGAGAEWDGGSAEPTLETVDGDDTVDGGGPLLLGVSAPAARTTGAPRGTYPVAASTADGSTSAQMASTAAQAPGGAVIAGLLPAAWSGPGQRPVLDALGVPRWSVRDLVERLGTLTRPPAWWRRLYPVLADWATPRDPEALATVPVPLADGRVATGARGLLLADPGLDVADLTGLRLRIVAPAAADPVLERWGAQRASGRALLLDPAVREAVEESLDEDDPEPVTGAVLGLLAGSDADAAELPWLAELALPDAEGDWAAAGELCLPGSPLAELVEPGGLGRVADDAVRRWGSELLARAGALSGFTVVPLGDLEPGALDDLLGDGDGLGPGEPAAARPADGDLDPEAVADVDGVADWYAAVLARLPADRTPPRLLGVQLVRDLDLIRPDAWPQALPQLAVLPARVSAPVVAVRPDGSRERVPSYLTWWLCTHPVLDGRRPDRLRRAGDGELSGLYDAAPDGLPSEVRELLGLAGDLADVLAGVGEPAALGDLLARLADPGRAVSAAVATTAYPRLADRLLELGLGWPTELPQRVRTVRGDVASATDAFVLDRAYLLPLAPGPLVAGGARPGDVADLLDLPLLGDELDPAVVARGGRATGWAEQPGGALAAARLGLPALGGEVRVCSTLTADGVPVDWWPGDDSAPDLVVEAAGPTALGRALAWRYSRWELRAALAEALGPDPTDRLWAEDAVAGAAGGPTGDRPT